MFATRAFSGGNCKFSVTSEQQYDSVGNDMDNDENLKIILETPRGSRIKYSFDEETQMFECKFTMPLGMTFPFDFGFVPFTLAEDGDPIDVLVLMDEPCVPGTFVRARLVGALLAEQTERDDSRVRNDRIIAVQSNSLFYDQIQDVQDISNAIKEQLENFFVSYNKPRGKTFECLGWVDSTHAHDLVDVCLKKYRESKETTHSPSPTPSPHSYVQIT